MSLTRKIGVSLALLLATTVAIAAAPSEYFDERTGATSTIVREPLVFPLGLPSGQDHFPDFMSLTTLEIDHGGHLSMFVVAYAWSRVDRLAQPLVINIDDQSFELQPLSEIPSLLPDDRRLLSPGKGRIPRAAYAVNRDMIYAIAASKRVALSFGEDPESFELVDGKKALIQFIEHLIGH